MKSFRNSQTKVFISRTFQKYGDLINFIAIGLAAVESVLIGLRLIIPPLFVMTVLLICITPARFFAVRRNTKAENRHCASTVYNWTIYSALLTGLIWGGSCFFLPLDDPTLLMTHLLFLFLIATIYSILFSPLSVLSPVLTTMVLGPIAILLLIFPTNTLQALPVTIFIIGGGLIAFSHFHGRDIRSLYDRRRKQRKNQLLCQAREKRITELEQIITNREERLRRQQKKHPHIEPTTELLFQAAKEAIAHLTVGGHILKANDHFNQITDHQKIIIGSTVFSQLFPKEMVDNLNIALQATVSTGQEISFSITHKSKRRQVIFVPSLDDDQNVLDVTVFFDDATRQNLNEETIAQNNLIWDTVLSLTSHSMNLQTWPSCFSPILPNLCKDMAADGLFIVVTNGSGLDASNAALINRQTSSYSWIFSVGSWMAALYNHETIHDITARFSKKEQALLDAEQIQVIALVPVFLENNLWGIIGSIRTTSDNLFSELQIKTLAFLGNILALHAENEMNRLEKRRLAAVVEQSDDCILITDPDGAIQYANPACKKITGHESSELIDRNIRRIHASDTRQTIWKKISDALQKREKWQGHFINRRKDQTIYEEEMTLSPIYDSDDKMTNMVISKRNITEAKRMESIAEAANLMDNIGFIFSSLRHELGNPINSIKVSLSILEANLDNYETEDVRRFLDRNLSDVKRVEYILDTLKNFSVFEKPITESIDMRSMLDQFTNLVKPDIEKKKVKLILNIADDEMIGLIDPRAFQQVMLNLVTNAIDALHSTTNKRITIAMYKEENNTINLTIGDNGCGIDESELASLFRPFFTTKPKGTGLGLVIVKKMLSKMNCSINIHSKRSVGTQIIIIVPAAEE